MMFNDFMRKYKRDPVRCALDCDLRPSTIYAYMAGRRKPLQGPAEKLEAWCDGVVTVMELRGKDDRLKRRETA